MMYLKKMFDGEIIFHFQKTVLLQVKALIQIIVTFRTEKISLYHPQNILLRGIGILCTNNHCVVILSKGTN